MAKFIGIDSKMPHIAFVAVTVKEPRLVNGEWVEVDNAVEVPVRKEKWDSLKTEKQREAYAQECAEYWSPQGPGWEAKKAARRAAWDADDEAKERAKRDAEKAAEEEKFIVKAMVMRGEKVLVRIQHHGLTFNGEVAKGADKAEFEANCRTAFSEYEAKVAAEKAELEALSIG